MDDAMHKFVNTKLKKDIFYITQIGIHHEKQHQELLLTDIKYILGHNPLFPVYDNKFKEPEEENWDKTFTDIIGGLFEIGLNSEGFCYDNELDRHQVYLEDFKIRTGLVTNAEY